MGAGLWAFALTMIFRHTVATLALLFVYSLGGEIVVNLLPFEGAARWSVFASGIALLSPISQPVLSYSSHRNSATFY